MLPVLLPELHKRLHQRSSVQFNTAVTLNQPHSFYLRTTPTHSRFSDEYGLAGSLNSFYHLFWKRIFSDTDKGIQAVTQLTVTKQ